MTPVTLVDPRYAEPRWPLLLALAALCGLQAALPSSLLMGGSRWVPLGSVVGLLVPAVILHRRDVHDLNQVLGYMLNGVVTLTMIWSLALLIEGLPAHLETPQQLLGSAASLWVINVLVFAAWDWRLDEFAFERDRSRGGG